MYKKATFQAHKREQYKVTPVIYLKGHIYLHNVIHDTRKLLYLPFTSQTETAN